MRVEKVRNGIYGITENLEGVLFEGMWEMPKGVSVNSYVVKGEKAAFIDGVFGWDGTRESMDKVLAEMNLTLDDVEYIVINHMEPDHSSWIADLDSLGKELEIYCSKESASILKAFFGREDRITVVEDGDTLDLGDGRILHFAKTPNIHWPDTIATYDEKSKVLFSCDAFGSFGKLTHFFDDEYTEEERDEFETQQIRYFSNILGTFTPMVGKGIERVKKFDIEVVAPGHGMVWRENPNKIIADFERYVSYQKGLAKEKVLVLWGSMYGMTRKMVDAIEETLKEENMDYVSLCVTETDMGTVLEHAWASTGIIIAAPTYEYKIFPPMASVLDEMGRKRIQNRLALYAGSYGWSGGAIKEFNEIMKRNIMKWDVLHAMEFNGTPLEEDIKEFTEAIRYICRAIREKVAGLTDGGFIQG